MKVSDAFLTIADSSWQAEYNGVIAHIPSNYVAAT
jgi:hypothetical protein